MVHKIKETLVLDKPAYVGMCILDLSKRLMYDFHYHYVKNRYGEKAKLLFTDTDSLCYEIETQDIYRELWGDINLFENSDYPIDSPFCSAKNKKVIDKIKDEAGGLPICEFIGLRSKMYSYVKDNGKNQKTAKGVRKYVIKKNITHEYYKDCLLNGKQMLHSKHTIRSECHQIGSYRLNETSLSCFDDKDTYTLMESTVMRTATFKLGLPRENKSSEYFRRLYKIMKLTDRHSCTVTSSHELGSVSRRQILFIILLTVAFYYYFERTLFRSPIHYSVQCGMSFVSLEGDFPPALGRGKYI